MNFEGKSANKHEIHQLEFVTKYKKQILIAVTILFLLLCWYFRYEVTPITSNSNGGVAYLNKWTGVVTVVPLYGKSEEINLN